MKKAIAVLVIIGVVTYGAWAVTAAQLNQSREQLIHLLQNTQEPKVVDAIAAGVQALSTRAEKDAFADAFARSLGLEKVDLTIPIQRSREIEAMRKLAERVFVDPDAAIAGAKAASALKTVDDPK